MSLTRRLLYAALTTVLTLVLLEGSARLLETHWSQWLFVVPSPDPDDDPGEYRVRATGRTGVDLPFLGDERRQDEVLSNRWDGTNRKELYLAPHDTWVWSLTSRSRFGACQVEQINFWGLRGPDPVLRERDEVRLLTLGDSSVMGYGVCWDQIFSSVSAERLGAAWDRPVRPIVGAVGGHSSEQSRVVLDDVGKSFAPHWVVIASLWSDVYGDDGASAQPVSELARSSALYRLLARNLATFQRPRQVGWFEHADDLGGYAGRRPRVQLQRYEENLVEMALAIEALGARPVFLVLPAQVDFLQEGAPGIVQDYRSVMRALAVEFEAPLVDGPRLFTQAGDRLGLFLDNVHPSAEGHALLGAALAEALGPLGPDPAREPSAIHEERR